MAFFIFAAIFFSLHPVLGSIKPGVGLLEVTTFTMEEPCLAEVSLSIGMGYSALTIHLVVHFLDDPSLPWNVAAVQLFRSAKRTLCVRGFLGRGGSGGVEGGDVEGSDVKGGDVERQRALPAESGHGY